jgi:hypothetical protein
MVVRFTAKFDRGYGMSVEGESSGLWTMIATADQHSLVRFSNVYGSTEQALRDAELFAHFALGRWGLSIAGSIEWRRL